MSQYKCLIACPNCDEIMDESPCPNCGYSWNLEEEDEKDGD